jgi:HSP20 family protein
MLMQSDPFREFDRLAEQLAAGARTPRPFPMDAYRRGDEFVVSFDLPGMDPGTIDLTVEQNVLTIKAQCSGPCHQAQSSAGHVATKD